MALCLWERNRQLGTATADVGGDGETGSKSGTSLLRSGLNQVLVKAGFDAFVEKLCARFYAERLGRPSLRPGRYFRLLLVGYFEGLNSERAIAWRVSDSASVRALSGIRPGGGAAESFDLVADATADRRGDARRGVHPGAEAVGGRGSW